MTHTGLLNHINRQSSGLERQGVKVNDVDGNY